MKKSRDYILNACNSDEGGLSWYSEVNDRVEVDLSVIERAIRQAQIDAIEETVKLCAEKATADVEQVWGGNTGSEYYIEYAIINKQSILNCAEILKQQL